MISVCAAHWNRQEALDQMFRCYVEQYNLERSPTLPLEFSICDDGSEEIPEVLPGWTTLTLLPRKSVPLNPCVPINHAVNKSEGETIVLTSPEVEHREPVLLRMLEMLEGPRDYITASCRDTDGEWLAGPDTKHNGGGRSPVPPGADFHFCAMFTRELWEAVGGFDEDYRYGQACDDNDWLWRVYEAGARFKRAPVTVWHHRTHVRWKLPHNRKLFEQKWPAARQAAISARTPSTGIRVTKEGVTRVQFARGRTYLVNEEGVILTEGRPALPSLTTRSDVVDPTQALCLGGAECVWADVMELEAMYGRQWDGLIIAANDIGVHWPREFDHWVTLHPNKMERWKRERVAHQLPMRGIVTWGGMKQKPPLDYHVEPWQGGSSGLLAVQVAHVLGCARVVLCGIPMTPTPHFAETTERPKGKGKNWTAADSHLQAWKREERRMRGWVRSVSGMTKKLLGAPTPGWLGVEE